jgi:hypothetical protein
VAVAALGVGVTLALARPPGKVHPTAEAPAAPSAQRVPPAPPPAVEATAAPPAAVETTPPERPSRPPAAHARPRPERRPGGAASATKSAAGASDSVKRGVLPSGSREAYPDQ